MPELPEFANPPVVEVAVSVQFRPLFGMRGLTLAPLRERWKAEYPQTQEHAPLTPVVEGRPTLTPQLQFNVVSLPSIRQWFLNDSGTQLVQVQPDRLIVNWRAGDMRAEYPRYGHMREAFIRRFSDLSDFVAEQELGELEINQTELTYINAMEVTQEDLGRIDRFLKGWSGTTGHHLGEPEQARMTLAFLVDGLGQPPSRLYVEVNPAQRPSGEPVLFVTLSARGNPGGRGLAESLKFIDEAHEHIVRSFTELTEDSMHEVWGRRT